MNRVLVDYDSTKKRPSFSCILLTPTALPLTIPYFQNAVFDYILEIKVFNSPTNILLILVAVFDNDGIHVNRIRHFHDK
ncbi:hypothetical protein J2S21_003819 [Peribacillus cavernae]|nr:hypothetical protein [Peribacillus cavernae]